MRKFFSFVAAVLFAGSMMAGVAEIKFLEDVAKDETNKPLNDSVFTVEGSAFTVTTIDPEGKMKIDPNNANFVVDAEATEFDSFTKRLNVAGKSTSSKNYLVLNIPEAGTLRIGVRAGNKDATDRNLVVAQGTDTLYNQIVKDADSIKVNDIKCFPYIFVNVAQGEARISYPVNGMYFYSFALITEDTPADPTNCAEAREAALSVSANNELYNDSAVYTITGYVTSIQTAYSEANHNISFWMADTENGGNVIQAYRAVCASADDAPGVGDKVAVTGCLTKYNTTPEFAAKCTFVIVERSTPAVNLGEKTIAEFLELKNFKDTCVLTGTIANVVNTQYGNFDLVELGNAEVKVYVYGLLTAAGESKKCYEEENLAEGDTITVKAIYTTYNNAPQVKNAIFVEVKKAAVAPGEEINVTISSLTNPGQVFYADAIASYGYWDIYAYNDQYEIEISNTYTTEAAGTYTIDDLDAKYTYIVPAEGDTVHFTAGQVVLSITDGVVNVAGQLTGDDNNIYNVNLTYKDPVAEQTVNVNIPEGVLFEGYATYGLYAVYGYAEDSTYVQLAIWTEAGFEGEFTEDDLDNKYVGSGLKDAAGNSQQIYAAAITVTPGAIEGAYTITADLLCYNNTLYKVTMKIGEEQQGINNVEAAVEAIKRIVNGQLVIEKAGKTYNVNGAVVR